MNCRTVVAKVQFAGFPNGKLEKQYRDKDKCKVLILGHCSAIISNLNFKVNKIIQGLSENNRL